MLRSTAASSTSKGALERLTGELLTRCALRSLLRFVNDDHVPRYRAQLDFQLGYKLVRHDDNDFADETLQGGQGIARRLLQ